MCSTQAARVFAMRDVFQQDARCVPTRCAMCSNKMRSTHAARGIVEQARQQDAFHTRWNKRANKMRSTHTARGTVDGKVMFCSTENNHLSSQEVQ